MNIEQNFICDGRKIQICDRSHLPFEVNEKTMESFTHRLYFHYAFASTLTLSTMVVLVLWIVRRDRHPLNMRPFFFTLLFLFGILWTEYSFLVSSYLGYLYPEAITNPDGSSSEARSIYAQFEKYCVYTNVLNNGLIVFLLLPLVVRFWLVFYNYKVTLAKLESR
jgi:hypothetical protein